MKDIADLTDYQLSEIYLRPEEAPNVIDGGFEEGDMAGVDTSKGEVLDLSSDKFNMAMGPETYQRWFKWHNGKQGMSVENMKEKWIKELVPQGAEPWVEVLRVIEVDYDPEEEEYPI